MRSDSGSRFAAQNIIQARECAALVIEPVVVEERIADPPPSETIDNDVELILGRAFGRWAIPGEDTLIESVHFIDDWQFDFQSGVRDRANDFTETRDDHSFILMDNEQQGSPLERRQNEKNSQDRHQSGSAKSAQCSRQLRAEE